VDDHATTEFLQARYQDYRSGKQSVVFAEPPACVDVISTSTLGQHILSPRPVIVMLQAISPSSQRSNITVLQRTLAMNQTHPIIYAVCPPLSELKPLTYLYCLPFRLLSTLAILKSCVRCSLLPSKDFLASLLSSCSYPPASVVVFGDLPVFAGRL